MSARGKKALLAAIGAEKDLSASILRATHSTQRETLTRRDNSRTHILRCLVVSFLVTEANKRRA